MAALQVLGADGLLCQSIEDLVAVGREMNPSIEEFEASCFTGTLVLSLCRTFTPAPPSE